MFIRAKQAKQINYYCLVESERVNGTHHQKTIHYLGNYDNAIATLPNLPITDEERQRFANRIIELESSAQARAVEKPKGKRGRPRKAVGHQGNRTLSQ